jgi:hypothetical protein
MMDSKDTTLAGYPAHQVVALLEGSTNVVDIPC